MNYLQAALKGAKVTPPKAEEKKLKIDFKKCKICNNKTTLELCAECIQEQDYQDDEIDENQCRTCGSTDKHEDKCLDCLNALWRD